MWSELKSCFLYERTRWFLWVPVFFAAGIGVYFALPSEPPLWTAAAPFALLPLLWLFRRRPVVRGVVLLLLLATAGFADVQLKSFCLSRKAPPAEDGKLYLRGRIDRLDTNYRGRPRILLLGLPTARRRCAGRSSSGFTIFCRRMKLRLRWRSSPATRPKSAVR